VLVARAYLVIVVLLATVEGVATQAYLESTMTACPVVCGHWALRLTG
jgi:hypothetical protein